MKDITEMFGRDNLVSTLRESKRVIGALAVAGTLIGAGLTFVVAPQWEAVTVLQVGQTDTGGAVPIMIEPTPRAAERMRLSTFRDNAFRAAGIPTNDRTHKFGAPMLRGSVKVVLLRNADLIQLTARGFSPEQANSIAMAYEKTLASYHGRLSEPTINRMRSELKEVEGSLSTETARREQIRQMLSKQNDMRPNSFSQNVLLVQMSADNDRLLRTLENRKVALREQLDSNRTFNTHSLGPVEVSEAPVYPRRMFFVLGGLLLGAAIGCAGALLRSWVTAGARDGKHTG